MTASWEHYLIQLPLESLREVHFADEQTKTQNDPIAFFFFKVA